MGRKTLPCNLTEEEQTFAWEQFDNILDQDEEKMVLESLNHYLFYYTEQNGRERDCICTHAECGRFTMQKKFEAGFFSHKHGDEIQCPVCGEVVKLIALGKMHSFESLNREKWKRITICRTGKAGALLLMSGYAKRYFCWDDLRPLPEISWKSRVYLMPGKRMQWFREMMPVDQDIFGRWNWAYQWHPLHSVREPFQPAFYDNYGDSFFLNPGAIEDSGLKYCQLEDWMYKEAGIWMDTMDDPVRNAIKFLAAYTRYPTLEMAVKLDMHSAATELVVDGKKNHRDLNWDASTMQGFLRLNKQDAKAFVNAGGDLKLLKSYHEARREEMVANMQEYIMLLRRAGGLSYGERLTAVSKRAGCTIHVAVNYVGKFPGGIGYILTMWGDYLNMAVTLGYDLTRRDVTMPKDLYDRHDAAAETVRQMKIMVDDMKYEGYTTYLRKQYEFEYGDMCIVVPGSVEDIVNEGKTLQHCVGGYAARHFDHKVVILFLRHKRKPNTPYMTIEIVPRNTMHENVVIRQIHGYKNELYGKYSKQGGKTPAKPSIKYAWFLDEWKKWVKSGSKRDKKGKPVLPSEKEKTA